MKILLMMMLTFMSLSILANTPREKILVELSRSSSLMVDIKNFLNTPGYAERIYERNKLEANFKANYKSKSKYLLGILGTHKTAADINSQVVETEELDYESYLVNVYKYQDLSKIIAKRVEELIGNRARKSQYSYTETEIKEIKEILTSSLNQRSEKFCSESRLCSEFEQFTIFQNNVTELRNSINSMIKLGIRHLNSAELEEFNLVKNWAQTTTIYTNFSTLDESSVNKNIITYKTKVIKVLSNGFNNPFSSSEYQVIEPIYLIKLGEVCPDRDWFTSETIIPSRWEYIEKQTRLEEKKHFKYTYNGVYLQFIKEHFSNVCKDNDRSLGELNLFGFIERHLIIKHLLYTEASKIKLY